MAIIKSSDTSRSLSGIMNYTDKDNLKLLCVDGKSKVVNAEKGLLSRGINCSAFLDVAENQMKRVVNHYGKSGGREYKHYILSFGESEFDRNDPASIKKALDYAEKLMRKHIGKKFMAYLGVHINSHGDESDGCLHVHIVILSVGIDGKKFQSSPRDMDKLKDTNDKLAAEHGFNIPERGKNVVSKRAKMYGQKDYSLAHSGKIYYKDMVIKALSNVLESGVSDFKSFESEMLNQGWYIKLTSQSQMLAKSAVDKYRNGKTISFNVRLLAKEFCRSDLMPVSILKSVGCDRWKEFDYDSGRSHKRQCADAIKMAINKNPKNFEAFKQMMNDSGWNVSVAEVNCHSSIRLTLNSRKRKSGNNISFLANRLAVDFTDVGLASQIIRQRCNEIDYVLFSPRIRKNKKFGEDVANLSAEINRTYLAEIADKQIVEASIADKLDKSNSTHVPIISHKKNKKDDRCL